MSNEFDPLKESTDAYELDLSLKSNEFNYEELLKSLRIQCEECCGLCCTALFFSRSDGFPKDKTAGTPCVNLNDGDFRCEIHPELKQRGLKGCLSYDCFGAGQKVTQSIYHGKTWRETPDLSAEIYQVFLTVYRLQQILWYLLDTYRHIRSKPVSPEFEFSDEFQSEIPALSLENIRVSSQSPREILSYDIDAYQKKVNDLLRTFWNMKKAELPQSTVKQKINKIPKLTNVSKSHSDYTGSDLQNKNLSYQDFSLSLLIAANLENCDLSYANFLAADLRDANLKNADLRKSIFLTQGQINSAKGNRSTKLPETLHHPDHW